MHDEYDSLGAAFYVKSPASYYDDDGDGTSPDSISADGSFVLAGCLVDASYQLGQLQINTRRCLSDFLKQGGIGAFERRKGSFRSPGTISGTLVYGPAEWLKIWKWANHDPTGTDWDVKLIFTDSHNPTSAPLLANSSNVSGKALLETATIVFPADGGRVSIDNFTVPFSQREVWTPRTDPA